jgi:fungalysin metallopeptidase (M36)
MAMPINFIPNDPAAGPTAPGMRVQAPRPNRPASRSGFTFSGVAPEGTFAPGTPQFLFWQCREGALAALDAWEASSGAPHTRWQGNRRNLRLRQDAGVDLNAFYDRASFSFFRQVIGTTTFFSGASTDVVAHELGHGLLDSIRPDLWGVMMLEAGAFHEALGDCVAILTALEDTATRQKLLAVTTNLKKKNFVESTAEDLSKGIRLIEPTHNAAEPRHAFNKFKFQLPETLPVDGGPGALINEEHSFGMLFSGCFWELIVNLFAAAPSQTPGALRTAARLAGSILIEGTRVAVVAPRFFQSVGRAMVLADQSMNGGANGNHIRTAFERHGILLGSNAMLAPTMALAGPAPKAASLAATTRRDLVQRLGGGRGARLSVAAADVFGTRMVQAVHTRDVPLGNLHPRLKGVVAVAHEPVMVGDSGGRASVVGALPHAVDSETEVRSFVQSLLEHGRIELGGTAKKKTKSVVATAATAGGDREPTHAIRSVGGKKTLQRIRFRCACCGASQFT